MDNRFVSYYLKYFNKTEKIRIEKEMKEMLKRITVQKIAAHFLAYYEIFII